MKCRLGMVENHIYVSHSQVLCSLGTVSWVARCGNTSGKLSCAITSGLVSFSQSELSRWSQSTCRSIRHLSARKSWSCQFSGEHWPPTTILRFSHLTTFASLWNQWMNEMSSSTWPLSVCSWRLQNKAAAMFYLPKPKWWIMGQWNPM